MDNHSLRSPEDEGHRGHAATNQRYGEKTRYHAIRRASPRERHQDPPKGRRCQRNGQEMSTMSCCSLTITPFVFIMTILREATENEKSERAYLYVRKTPN